MSAPAQPARVNVLGVGVSAVNRQTSVSLILEAMERRQRGYIAVTSVHGVMEAQADARFRTILNSSFLCVPDGVPLFWIGRLAGHRQISRVYGPDLMLDVCRASVPGGYRHFVYGGKPGVARELSRCLSARFSGLNIVGAYEPPFRPLNAQEEAELSAQVAAVRPDVLWVGLSTPKQERFMAEYLPRLDVTLMIGVGAAFDIHTGRTTQAPRWVRHAGFEWLYRLCHEPRRLWRRNLLNLWFLPLAAGQWCGLKTYNPSLISTGSERSRS